MQVIDTTENQLCEFSTLSPGEVFFDSESNLYFMKTFDTDKGNAVGLKSGHIYPFEQDECVTPMSAKIIISRKEIDNEDC